MVGDEPGAPPPDEPVTARYLRILADEQVIDPDDVDLAPQIVLTSAERTAGEQVLANCGQGQQPVVLVPAAGMASEGVAALAGAGDGADRTGVRGRGTVGAGGVARRPGPAAPAGVLAPARGGVRGGGRRGGVVVGPDTGPMRVAAAVGARRDLQADAGQPLRSRTDQRGPQGLPDCPHRCPTAITEQVCWWRGAVPDLAAGTGVHGRRRPGPGPRPGGRPRFGVGIEEERAVERQAHRLTGGVRSRSRALAACSLVLRHQRHHLHQRGTRAGVEPASAPAGPPARDRPGPCRPTRRWRRGSGAGSAPRSSRRPCPALPRVRTGQHPPRDDVDGADPAGVGGERSGTARSRRPSAGRGPTSNARSSGPACTSQRSSRAVVVTGMRQTSSKRYVPATKAAPAGREQHPMARPAARP